MSALDRHLPMNTKAKRVLKLVKPAPLKRSLPNKSDPDKLSAMNSVVNSADKDNKQKVLPISEANMTSVERPLPLNTKARRVGKLEKPAPLKRSLSANTGSEETLTNVTSSAKTDNSAEEQCAKKMVNDSETMVGTEKFEDASSGKLLFKL